MSEQQNDDVVWKYDQSISSDAVLGKTVIDELLGHLRNNDWSAKMIFGIHLAVEEALVNAIKHGNRMNPKKLVTISIALKADRLKIRITDEGDGFDPSEVPDCTDPENLEVPSGRGLLLMRNFMTRVEHNGTGNSVTMEKDRISALVPV